MKKPAYRQLYLASAIACTALGAPAFAQSGDGALAREVVQPLPSQEVQRLNSALRRLAANSRNLSALTDAGKASLELGDLDAALGFFGRAQDIAPDNALVKMGMAAVFLRSDRPIEALRLFSEAEAAGASSIAVSAERGLAYDLVGNNAQAQESYKIALQRGAGSDVKRRLAISHAIAGNKEDFEITLQPLVAQRDFAAFRARAFGLAILGETGEANAIADAVMPRDLAARMAPYLAYMPRLTKAQQAAAANLGIFPKAADIGRDNPRIAQYANAAPVAGVDARLAPRGAPLGQAATDNRRRRPDRTGAGSTMGVIPPDPAPTPSPALAANTALAPSVSDTPAPALAAATVPAPTPQPTPAPSSPPGPIPVPSEPARTASAELEPINPTAPSIATIAAPIVQSAPASGLQPVETPPESALAQVAPKPEVSTFDLAKTVPAEAQTGAGIAQVVQPAQASSPVPSNSVASTPVASTPVVQSAPIVQPAPAPRPSVTAAFADFASGGRTSIAASEGAVDLSKIDVKREPKPEPPKPESQSKEAEHPKRFWVQIASVKDRSVMRSEFRRIARKADDLLDGYSAHGAEWGETNRLLAGPLPSSKRAEELVGKLKGAGVDSFVHTSAAGKRVDKLQ